MKGDIDMSAKREGFLVMFLSVIILTVALAYAAPTDTAPTDNYAITYETKSYTQTVAGKKLQKNYQVVGYYTE